MHKYLFLIVGVVMLAGSIFLLNTGRESEELSQEVSESSEGAEEESSQNLSSAKKKNSPIEILQIKSFELKTDLDYLSDPEFSPDGTKVVFRAGIIEESDIYLLDLQAKEIIKIIGTKAEEVSPRFSLDGQEIIFSSDGKIKKIKLDGGEVVTLTDTTDDFDPSYTSRGTILFSSFRSGIAQLWEMNTDGSNPRQLTNFRLAWQPVEIPSGDRIVFVTGEDIGDFYVSNDIAIMDRDGSSLQVLTTAETQDNFPEVSPDGKTIVFQALGESRKVTIRIINIDGTNLRELQDSRSQLNAPAISPGGDLLVYTSRNTIIVKRFDELQWKSVK